MRRLVAIISTAACVLGMLTVATVGAAPSALALAGPSLIPPSVATAVGADAVPACVALGPCAAAGTVAAVAGAGLIAGLAAGTGAVEGVKFAKDKWFTFHPEGQA
jgi:hypothetical protein